MKEFKSIKDINDNIRKTEVEKIPKEINLNPSFRAGSVYNKFSENSNVENIRQNGKVDINSLREFIKLMPAGGVVLDIGCGKGFETNYFQECGFKAYGIDIAENNIKIAKELFPKCNYSVEDLSSPTLFSKYKPDGVYECLALMYLTKDTIGEVFKSIYDNLSEGGIFQLTVEEDYGDRSGWYSVPTSQPRMWKGKEAWLVDFVYLSYFKLEEIIPMLAKPGFEIVTISRGNQENIVSPLITILCRKRIIPKKPGTLLRLVNFLNRRYS